MLGVEDGLNFILVACAIFLLAGTIKGAIGIGLPTTAMSLFGDFTNCNYQWSAIFLHA